MSDGTLLATEIYLPNESLVPIDGVPAALERTPYDRNRPSLYQMGMFLAARGYAVVVQDCRGRYDSEGVFRYMVGEDPEDVAGTEAMDGYDTVEWIAGQPWCNGKVGTTGLSYTGANQQALAVLRPPHLTTQIILDAGFNYWSTASRHGGALTVGMILPQAFRMAADSREAHEDLFVREQLRDALKNLHVWMAQLPLQRGQSPLSLVPAYEDYYLAIASYEDETGFWQGPISNLERHVQSYPDIPVCFVTSWYGHHAYANFAKWQALSRQGSSQVKLICGHWLHGPEYMQNRFCGEVDFGNESSVNLNDFRLRWFDQHLKGMDTGLASEPPITVLVMGGGPGRSNPEGRLEHGSRWLDLPDWPPPGSTVTTYYLNPDGQLNELAPENEEGARDYSFDPSRPVPTIGGAVQDPVMVSGLFHGGAFDQRGRENLAFCPDNKPLADRSDVLVFRTAPLTEPVEMVGPVEVDLWVSSSAVDTDFTVKLIDELPPSAEYPAGFALNLCDDILRLRFRDGTGKADPAVAGQVYQLTFKAMVTGNLFGVGHRIRLDVSSSNWPMFEVNSNTGTPASEVSGKVTAINSIYMNSQYPSHLRMTNLIGRSESEAPE